MSRKEDPMKKRAFVTGISGFVLVFGLLCAGCDNGTPGGDSGGDGGGGGGGTTSKGTIVVINASSSALITMADIVSSGITVTSLASSGSPIGTNSQKSYQVDSGIYGVQIKTNTGYSSGSGTFSIGAGETVTVTCDGTSVTWSK
jgi:hypothetical protein